MAKGLQQQAGGQNLPADVTALIDQLERHCLAPDGSLVSKCAYYDLQLVPQKQKKKKKKTLLSFLLSVWLLRKWRKDREMQVKIWIVFKIYWIWKCIEMLGWKLLFFLSRFPGIKRVLMWFINYVRMTGLDCYNWALFTSYWFFILFNFPLVAE